MENVCQAATFEETIRVQIAHQLGAAPLLLPLLDKIKQKLNTRRYKKANYVLSRIERKKAIAQRIWFQIRGRVWEGVLGGGLE